VWERLLQQHQEARAAHERLEQQHQEARAAHERLEHLQQNALAEQRRLQEVHQNAVTAWERLLQQHQEARAAHERLEQLQQNALAAQGRLQEVHQDAVRWFERWVRQQQESVAAQKAFEKQQQEAEAVEKPPQRPPARRPQGTGRATGAPSIAPPERIEMFFRRDSQVMRQLNPRFSLANCPAAAAAVDEYLGTGNINPAPGAGPGYEFPFVRGDLWSQAANLRTLLNRNGAFVTVRGTRSEEYARLRNATIRHYFMVVNRSGTLWVIDGYQHMVAELNSYLSADQFLSLEYYRGPFRVGPPFHP
jgi:hypothetical protein